MILIIIITILIIGILVFLLFKSINNDQKEHTRALTGKYKEEIEKACAEASKYVELKNEAINEYQKTIAGIDISLQNKQLELERRQNEIIKQQTTLEQQLSISVADKQKIIDERLKNYWNEQINLLNEKYDEYEEDLQNELDIILNNYIEISNTHKIEMEKVQTELNEWQTKQNAINEEIQRRRELEEQQDFYRVCLNESTLNDVAAIESIKSRIQNIEKFNKLIYDNFISSSVKEMVKRVVGTSKVSGIYKITNIETNEIYIGQSVDIGTRWQNHCKSAYGLEGVADSQFQRALKKYGINNFTFEILEKCDKELVREREKYYITVYETNKYGYNQKIG